MSTSPTGTLQVRTRAIDYVPDLVACLPANQKVVSWVRRGEGLVGFGEIARFAGRGRMRFSAAQQWWLRLIAGAQVDDAVGLPGTGAVAFGSLTYAPGSKQPSVLVVPRVIIGKRSGRCWITELSLGGQIDGPDSSGRGAGSGQYPTDAAVPESVQLQPAAQGPGGVTYQPGSLTLEQWGDAVAEAVRRIQRGELSKVVLARSEVATSTSPIDPRWLLARLTASYDNTWVYAVDGTIGATPEMLVRLERGLVTSRVLAGTIRRTGDDTADLALAGSLARSSKDLQEHEFAVQSVAQALAGHTSSMNVPEAPFVLHLPNVMHLATDVAGVANDGLTSLALAEAIQPTAAVCGTPRQAANALIPELEQLDRGRYAGAIGWMDASGDGDWGLALRGGTLDADARRITLFAGCGIVAESTVPDEIAESVAKMLPMHRALSDE